MKINSIYNDDCFNVLSKLSIFKFDLILTDPPYNVSNGIASYPNSPDKSHYIKTYGKYTTDFGEWDKQNLDFKSLFNKFYNLLKDNGTLLMFYDCWKLQTLKEISEEIGFKQPRIGIWIKDNPVPLNSKINYLTNSKECFVTFVKKSKPIFNSEYDNAIYYYPITHGKERLAHPTQKPLDLIENLIKKHSDKNNLILDPFMGTGTTIEACINLDRQYIGIEKDNDYFKLASERIRSILEFF